MTTNMNTNIIKTPRRLSVSTWSLKRELGAPSFYGVGDELPAHTHRRDALLQLPAKLRNFGIQALELCHFHLPSRDENYLVELRAALQESEIELWSFLVDDGDLSDAENGAPSREWIEDWFETASALNAKNVRVIGGKSDGDGAMPRSVEAFQVLDVAAQAHNLRLLTENWSGVLATPHGVRELLEMMEGRVGLCFDFGNWDSFGKDKYDALREIAPFAESCHAKAHFETNQNIDAKDYTKCLDILREAEFSGPFTLIFDSDGNEWRGLEIERELVRPYLT